MHTGSELTVAAARDDSTLAALEDLATHWRDDREQRQRRTHLVQEDFDAIAATGFLRTVVPIEHGGTWRGTSGSVRHIASMVRVLAGGDPSVGLVSAMHPGVVAFWLTTDDPDDPAWIAQRDAVLGGVARGQRWGTVTSEPGTGGDIMATRAVAEPAEEAGPVPGATYRVSGDKHFASGIGVVDLMITTAVPSGEDEPTILVLDVGDRPWDGSAGLTLIGEWDGIGMVATQSHAMRLEGVVASRFASRRPLLEVAVATNPFILTLFTAAILGVADSAVAAARSLLRGRAETLRAYEQVHWARAERLHWLAEQALAGAIAAVEAGDTPVALHATVRAKVSVAELAEEALTTLGRVIGGGSFSLRSPFARWCEDVRALGFLRPPWALAQDQLLETAWRSP